MLFISVIVPVRNEARHIEHTLNQLLLQDYDPERFEVVVVDGESTDGTPELAAAIAQRHPNVHLLTNPRRLSGPARNIGVQQSRGDVVLFVDGHCEIEDKQYLVKLAAAFERSGADCVGRPQPQDVAGATALQRAIAAARSSRLGHHPDSYVYSSEEGFVPARSVAVAYRRSVFDAVGFFADNCDACEDLEFNHRVDRAGLRCFFTPEVAVHYVPRESLRSLFYQLTRYGRGRVRVLRKHPDTLSLGTVIPAFFVAGVLLGAGPTLFFRWFAAVYLAALLVYAILVLCGSIAGTLVRRNIGLLPWLPLVYLTIHVATGTGTLLELLRPAGQPVDDVKPEPRCE